MVHYIDRKIKDFSAYSVDTSFFLFRAYRSHGADYLYFHSCCGIILPEIAGRDSSSL